jgi:hypothetical protein
MAEKDFGFSSWSTSGDEASEPDIDMHSALGGLAGQRRLESFV